ncbi:MAG: glutaredoxin domain-containing protein [Desulfomonilaceae bacterium]
MINHSHFQTVIFSVNIFILCLCVSNRIQAQSSALVDSESDQTVVVTIFTSSQCPYCENVKELLDDLKTEFPIKTKIFDINNPHDYDLYCKIQATHKNLKFAIPLAIVGDSVFIGQSEIYANLEKAVKSLKASGEMNPLNSKNVTNEKSNSVHRPNHHEASVDSQRKHEHQTANAQRRQTHKMKIINDDGHK